MVSTNTIVVHDDETSQSKLRAPVSYRDDEMLAISKACVNIANSRKCIREYSFKRNVSDHIHPEYKYNLRE